MEIKMTTKQRPFFIPSMVSATMIMALVMSMASVAVAQEDSIAVLQKTSRAFASVAEKVKPAVVNIRVEKTSKVQNSFGQNNGQVPDEFYNHPFFKQFFGPQMRQRSQPQPRTQMGQGSGFIIEKDGYILTNNHVVEGADTITVHFNDGKNLDAKLIGADPLSDVALIKVESDKDLPTVPMGNSDAMEVGEWVIAIGNPFGLTQTVTVGIVSAKGRSQVGLNEYENFIQTDAAINPGNSGGPLLNIQGEVIGINSALYSRSGGYMGIGFAIPINMAQAIEKQLQDTGKVTRGWLGVVIQDVDENLAKSFGLKDDKGVLLTNVQANSPAEKSGLKDGDIVLSIDGVKVDDSSALRNKVALIEPGTKMKMRIVRDGHKKTLFVKAGERPSDPSAPIVDVNESAKNDFGLGFQELTPEVAAQLGYNVEKGVVIREVASGSVAGKAGLKPGMLIEQVNKIAVFTIADIKKALKRSPDPKRVLLRVNFGQGSRYIALVAK